MSRMPRLVRLLLVAALLAFVPPLSLPRSAVACSCMEQRPLAQYARNGSVIVAGRVDGREARGVRVAVARWFAGPGAAPVTWIAGDFGNGASCGVGSAPAVGTEWIWVAWRPEGAQDLSISICAPVAELDTDAGQELLAEAIRTFGPGTGSGVVPGTTGEPAATGAGVDPVVVLAGGIVVVAGLVVLGAAGLAARRRDRV